MWNPAGTKNPMIRAGGNPRTLVAPGKVMRIFCTLLISLACLTNLFGKDLPERVKVITAFPADIVLDGKVIGNMTVNEGRLLALKGVDGVMVRVEVGPGNVVEIPAAFTDLESKMPDAVPAHDQNSNTSSKASSAQEGAIRDPAPEQATPQAPPKSREKPVASETEFTPSASAENDLPEHKGKVNFAKDKAATAEDVFLATAVETPIVKSGKALGHKTVPLGTPVKIIETKGQKVKVRMGTGDIWVTRADIMAEPLKPAPAPHADAIKSGERWEWAILPKYEEATPFGESGLAWVKRDGRWLVINRKRQEIFCSPFDSVAEFSENGYAVGKIGGAFRLGKYGLVGPEGRLVLEPEWDEIGEPIRGFVPVKRDRKWGYTDLEGNLVIPCEWDDTWRFSAVGTAIVTRDGKRGFIDSKGKVIVEPVWDGAINHTQEGIGAVRRGDGWGLLDQDGNLLCEPEWKMKWALKRFDLGWLPVWKTEEGMDKVGILSTQGKLLVPAEWDKFLPAAGGALLSKNGGECIFVAAEGKIVFTAPEGVRGISEERQGFFDDLAMVSSAGDGGKTLHGFIDDQGKLLIDYRARDYLPFSEGLAACRTGDLWGFVDRAGNEVVPMEWDEVRSFSEKRAAVSKAGKWGFVDPSGKLVVSPQWDIVGDYVEGLAAVGKDIDGKIVWSFLNLDGTTAFTVDSKIRLQENGYQKERITYQPSRFPTFRKGYLLGESNGILRIDRRGNIVRNLPISNSGFFLSKLPTSLSPRYPRWFGHYRKYDYPILAQLDLVDKEGTLVLPGVSSEINPSELIPYPGTPAYGWINEETGKVIMEPRFSYVKQLSDDLVLFREAEKFGVVTRDGRNVLTPEWDSIVFERNGMLTAHREGKVQVFTNDGIPLKIPPDLPGAEYVDYYAEDFVVRQPNGIYSLCSALTGNYTTFNNASKLYWNLNQAKAGLLWIQEKDSGKWSLVRRDGTPLGFYEDKRPKAWMHNRSFDLVRNADRKVLFLDSSGRPISTETWDGARHFENGLAAVWRKGEGTGFIDGNGEVKIPLTWDAAHSFKNVGTKSAPILVATVALRCADDGKRNKRIWGLIDSDGKVLIEPQSEREIRVHSHEGELVARVRKGNHDDLIPIYIKNEIVESDSEGEVIQELDGMATVINAKGQTVIPPQWEKIQPAGDGLFVCSNKTDRALIDREGNVRYRNTQDTRLVLWNEEAIPNKITRPVIFIERPPVWGYVKLQ